MRISDWSSDVFSSDLLSIAKLGPQLLPLALPYLSAGSIPKYLRILRMATQYKWAKAAFLDRLLTDMTFSLMRKHRPDYVSLFLNAGAHIQHHHMYDRSEEHTSELQSLMRTSYAVFCLKKKKN